MYKIVDIQTGAQIGALYKNVSKARARRDALDNAYGAYRYRVEFVV